AAAAQRDELTTATAAANRPRPDDPVVPLYAHEQAVGRAWLATAQGDLATGRALVLEAAEDAARRGAWLLELLALIEACRLGAGPEARARLEALTSLVPGPLADVTAAWARGAAAEASQAYEAMGALLLAAESAAATGTRHGRARSLELAARCEGARTPALGLGSLDPLTRREREVMELAAQGLTNREIAQRLYVSIRTVNAHLNHVYNKLALTDRTQLATYLHRYDPPG
ncbi:MAG: helix-turn-helix transcriptional regulator, partial [Acidimicrobiales bacterium]